MQNVALNKPALQSSTCAWSRFLAVEQDARGANNGKIDGDFGFHTGTEANPWWQVDLEDVHEIKTVKIYNRIQSAERMRLFSLLVSIDGQEWQNVFSKNDGWVFGAVDSTPYVVDFPELTLARFVRVRLNTRGYMHFNELEVFGTRIDKARLRGYLEKVEQSRQTKNALPEGRSGKMLDVNGFQVFADVEKYHPYIVESLEVNAYESRERSFIPTLLQPGQRVIEVGTAIGVVTMTAASIVGPENVATFEANAQILADARANFARNGLNAIKSVNGVMQNLRSFKSGTTLNFGISDQFWASRLDATADEADIIEVVQVPTYCLERELIAHEADVLICDIEGGEAELLTQADLPGVSTLLMETHYGFVGRPKIDAMFRSLVMKGFVMDLALSGQEIVVMRR